MAKHLRTATAACVVVGMFLAGAPGVASARPDVVKSKPATNSASDVAGQAGSATATFSLAIDPELGTTEVVSTSGNMTTRDRNGNVRSVAPRAQAATVGASPLAATSYTCVVQTQQNSNFRALTPFYSSSSGNSYEFSWVFHPYTISNARYVSGEYTFQIELCMSGGGHTWNDWHQWFQGAGMVVQDAQPRKIAQVWGNEVKNGQISTSLSFQVAAGPVTIGAATTVTPADTYSGSQGHEANMTSWANNTAWNINRVNAFYVAPHAFVWQGSADFQGNNAHALYEYPQSYKGKIAVSGMADARFICSLPGQVVGVTCDPL